MFFKKKNLEIISNTYKLIQGKYKKKQNIQLFLKNKTFSNSEIIKLAYDIQSGSYIKFFKKLNKKKKANVYFPLIKAINDNFKNVKTILDFGCGELTTSSYIFKNLNYKIKKYYANDISFNRLLVGSNELKKKLTKKNYNKFKIFCNSDNNLPFKDNSIDLVLTVHALEPNNQYKYKILNELLRVSKLGVILMEPHYEMSNVKQKKRMIRFDYIRGIERILKSKKIKYHIIKKKFHLNNLNKSSIFVLKNNLTKKKQRDNFVDPIKKNDLIKKGNFLYSKKTFRAFPIINDIVIFNEDSQIFLPNLK
jgi:SAM-dependent methyltransferase